MTAFDPHAYGPRLAPLIAEERLNPLDGGEPNSALLEPLQALGVESAFGPVPLEARPMAEAVISGLWLYHNYLDRSHTLSQAIMTPTGSFWHAIMHRREPDAANSAYWFRRVGRHPIFDALCAAAADEAQACGADGRAAFLASQTEWDPFAFIDLCEAARGRGDRTETLCRRVQLREWQLLFDFSFRRAGSQRTGAGEA